MTRKFEVTAYVDEEMLKDLRSISAQTRIPMSAIIRYGIDLALDYYEEKVAFEKTLGEVTNDETKMFNKMRAITSYGKFGDGSSITDVSNPYPEAMRKELKDIDLSKAKGVNVPLEDFEKMDKE
jgi:hypothetical protein